MKVIKLQTFPDHPVYEISDLENLNDLIDWLFYAKLEEKLSMSINESMFVFRTAIERNQFALGFQLAWSITG